MKKYKLHLFVGLLVIFIASIFFYKVTNGSDISDGYFSPIRNNEELENTKRKIVGNIKVNDNFTRENEDRIIEEKSTNEIITKEYFDIKMKSIGLLDPKRIVVTPGEDSTQDIGITFNLDYQDQDALVVVLDEEYGIIGEYLPSIQNFDILKDEVITNLYSYKYDIKGLNSSRINYVICSHNEYSKIYSIDLLPKEGPTMIAYFGDTQGYKQSQYDDFRKTYEKTFEYVEKIDLSYIAGDIVDTGDSWAEWSFFDQAIGDVLAESLFVTTIGNHDVKSGAVIYTNTFNYPENGIDGQSERNYYFDINHARIGVWDTEKPTTFVDQSKWLIDIMSESDKTFKIVFMHRSCYPAAYDEEYIRNLSSVFEDAGVDLVMSGHDHIYSRTTMMDGHKVNDNEGITYIVGGSSTGSKYYELVNEEERYWLDKVYDSNNPVFSLLSIEEDKIFIKAYAIEEEEVYVIDELVIQ